MNPREYFRTFQVGKLYFKFIKGTELEQAGWTGEKLAVVLKEWGFIGFTNLQEHDGKGRFTEGTRVYYEMPGKQINRNDLVKLVLSKCSPDSPGLIQRLFKKEST